jgi:predicted amidohydrolase
MVKLMSPLSLFIKCVIETVSILKREAMKSCMCVGLAVCVLLNVTTQQGEALRAAVGQVVSVTGTSPSNTVELNTNTLLNLANEAASSGAMLVTFPEFALQGDFPFMRCTNSANTSAYSEVLAVVGMPLNCSSAAAASRLGCSPAARSLYISYNTVEADGTGRYFNTQVVVHNGFMVARYRKYNVFYKDCFDTPTLELVTFTVHNTSVGIFTCFDILFEHPKMDLVHAGVQYFSYSSAIPLVGAEIIKLFSATNHVSVISANAASGQSEIVADGAVVGRASGSSGNAIVVADI